MRDTDDNIAIRHPEHIAREARWQAMDDALGEEEVVKGAGTRHLPKTGGMERNDRDGSQYEAYKARARFPEVTSGALSGIVGLIFEKDPVGASDEIITNAGQTNLELARDALRGVASKGREVLVVDAPDASLGGGSPFITRYRAEDLINWKADATNPAALNLAVFREYRDAGGRYAHEHAIEYRRFMRLPSGRVEVTRWRRVDEEDELLEDPRVLPIREMPIFVLGSIDLMPPCDPVPLLPVARAAFAYYRKSAVREHGLYLTGQPTPWVRGVTEDQYKAILRQGIGSSAFWYLGQEGFAGFLEVGAEGLRELKEAMDEELVLAQAHSVELVQRGDTAESGRSIAMRAMMRHASIYSMADAVSIGVTRAQRLRARWAGEAEPEDFALRTEFASDYASAQMVSALDRAINSGNAPRSAMFEEIRRARLSDKTDEEMIDEIEAGRPFVGAAPAAPAEELRDAA